MRRLLPQIATLGLLALASCHTGPPREKAIGEAFVGPVSLNLRADLAARSTVSATVRHGERLEILERRRRFAKVRTHEGVEGWTDGRVLLTPPQMARLRKVADRAAELPSQGKASVFDLLNVHTDPNRYAPSFYQIREEEIVDVIGGKVTPRVPYAPGKPDGFDAATVPANVELDDWSLLRLKDGRAGWVLARMVLMSIPDEVAQYAEGQRITSYFSLGKVKETSRDKTEEKLRDHWLWTTISVRHSPYDFDSLRVFVFNPRNHRYETSFIERNVKGYYPVVVEKPSTPGAMPNFTVLVEEKDGSLAKRTYEFHGFRVRIASREPYNGPREALGLPMIAEESPSMAEPSPGLWESMKKRMPRWGR
ncbi:MAG: SH3 domain-containing protein [Acidobacteriota bacterium]